MDHYIHRTLNYTASTKKLAEMESNEEYFDLIKIASLFNAIRYARVNGAHYQLASFSIDEKRIDKLHETVYITSGLLFEAFVEIERIAGRYKGKAFMANFEDMLDAAFNYRPPEVFLEVALNGPFRLVSKERDFSLETLKMDLFPMFTTEQKGFAVATVANESEKMEEFKRTNERPDVHESLENIVDYLADEFILGAEGFIFAIAKKLGLKPIEQLRLAA
ncbi:MAG: hypothetical protein IPL32_08040 [Chloracidobacterium sp.]|nr:hypothetical protein [Chloracidobacterium sp.]